MAALIAPYVDAGAEVSFVELVADLDTRLGRNRTEHRLAEKKSKRDVDWSDGNVRELERHVLNTVGVARTPAQDVLDRHPHLVLDNSELSADDAADLILAWLSRTPVTHE